MQWRRVLNTAHLLFLFLMWNHIQSSSSSELMMVHPVGINTYFCEIAVTHLSPPLKSPIMLVFRWYLQTSQRPGRSLKKQYVQRSNTLPGIEVSRWNGIFFAKSWVVSCNFMFCYPYDAIHKPTKEIVLGLLAPFEALKPSLCAVFRTKGSVKPSLKAVTSHILDHDAALFCSSFLNFTTSFPPQHPSPPAMACHGPYGLAFQECDGVTLHLKKRMDQLELKLREHLDDSLQSIESRVSQDFQAGITRKRREQK